MQEGRIYTIGHGTRNHNDFFAILSQYNINVLVDVRRIPYSKYAVQYNKDILEDVSTSYNISYLYMGESLGSPAMYITQRISYEEYTNDSLFLHGISRLINGVMKGYSIVLMCAEYEAYSCHRHILLAKILEERGISVYHIVKDSTLVPALSYSFSQYSLYG